MCSILQSGPSTSMWSLCVQTDTHTPLYTLLHRHTTHSHTYTCTRSCLQTHTRPLTHTWWYIHVNAHTSHTYTPHTYVYTHVGLHIHTHACTHIPLTYTCSGTLTHTPPLVLKPPPSSVPILIKWPRGGESPPVSPQTEGLNMVISVLVEHGLSASHCPGPTEPSALLHRDYS